MTGKASVSNWLEAFKEGDRDAARKLWNRYYHRMTGLARRKLGVTRRFVADEEDVAISAFDSFCQGLEAGQFADLQNRDELWKLLVMITIRKAINVARHQGRQKRDGDQAMQSDDQILKDLISREPLPVIASAMDEECQRLLDQLRDDQLRKLVLLKLEGHTNTQCAAELGRTRVTVQRMLKLIQLTWRQELVT